MDILGSGTIKCNFFDIKGHRKIVQGNGYYMPGLGENILISPQYYIRMECGGKMIVTMYMT